MAPKLSKSGDNFLDMGTLGEIFTKWKGQSDTKDKGEDDTIIPMKLITKKGKMTGMVTFLIDQVYVHGICLELGEEHNNVQNNSTLLRIL